MATVTFIKPGGTEIEVNDTPQVRAFAEIHRWEEKKKRPRKKAAPKKKAE